MKLPLLDNVNGGHSNSSGDEAVSTGDGNGLQGALDSVEDVVQNAGSQLNRERLKEITNINLVNLRGTCSGVPVSWWTISLGPSDASFPWMSS